MDDSAGSVGSSWYHERASLVHFYALYFNVGMHEANVVQTCIKPTSSSRLSQMSPQKLLLGAFSATDLIPDWSLTVIKSRPRNPNTSHARTRLHNKQPYDCTLERRGLVARFRSESALPDPTGHDDAVPSSSQASDSISFVLSQRSSSAAAKHDHIAVEMHGGCRKEWQLFLWGKL